MAIKKFKVEDDQNPNLVGIYDVEGANSLRARSTVGVVIDSTTGKITHLLNTAGRAVKGMIRTHAGEAFSSKLQKVKAQYPAYRDDGVDMYQQYEGPMLLTKVISLPESVRNVVDLNRAALVSSLDEIPNGTPERLNPKRDSGFTVVS